VRLICQQPIQETGRAEGHLMNFAVRGNMTRNGRLISAILLLLLTVGHPPTAEPAGADPDDLSAVRQQVETLRTELEGIKKQLGEIQKQFAQRPAPPAPTGPVTMSVGDGPSLGNKDAPVTIVEFSDYQCPFCRKHFTSTFAALKTGYIDTGKVRYVFRDFPLESIHPYARKAAEAAHCAGDQGKYWEMHDTMFANQGALKTDHLRNFARTMKLDLEAFNVCLDSGKYAKKVEADVAAGSAAGVTGTPGFFIGRTKQDGTIMATVMKGAQPASAFSQVIDRLLEEKTP
jgi:protein-disulfide isomerase